MIFGYDRTRIETNNKFSKIYNNNLVDGIPDDKLYIHNQTESIVFKNRK